jgi:hypothetical protein
VPETYFRETYFPERGARDLWPGDDSQERQDPLWDHTIGIGPGVLASVVVADKGTAERSGAEEILLLRGQAQARRLDPV